jgi:hypothetical protein
MNKHTNAYIAKYKSLIDVRQIDINSINNARTTIDLGIYRCILNIRKEHSKPIKKQKNSPPQPNNI